MMTDPSHDPPSIPARLEAAPWEPLVREWLLDLNRALTDAIEEGQADVEIGGQWGLIVGDERCGWTMLPCLDLHFIGAPHRPHLFAQIIARTGASALVYAFDGIGVWPEDAEGWRELNAYRAAHGGTIDGHPMAVRGVITLSWSADQILNLAVPFDGDKPGQEVRTTRSPGTTPYNQIILACELDPVDDDGVVLAKPDITDPA